MDTTQATKTTRISLRMKARAAQFAADLTWAEETNNRRMYDEIAAHRARWAAHTGYPLS